MILFDYHIEAKAFRIADYFFSYLEGKRKGGNDSAWIKVCNPGEHYQLATQLLRNEAEILKKIEPGICPEFYGYANRDSQEGLIFKNQKGAFLSELMPAGELKIEQVISIGIQILNALERLHQGQILHLAVHPGNIIWNQDSGKVILWGLGYAKPMFGSGTNLTGTPFPVEINPWMAPEQTGNLNLRADVRTDLYGFGATLYYLLSGVAPVGEDDDPLKLAHRILASPVPPLPEPEYPSILSRIISRLLDKSPDKRYQSIEGVRWDLQQLLEEPGLLKGKPDFVIGQHDKKHVFSIARSSLWAYQTVGDDGGGL